MSGLGCEKALVGTGWAIFSSSAVLSYGTCRASISSIEVNKWVCPRACCLTVLWDSQTWQLAGWPVSWLACCVYIEMCVLTLPHALANCWLLISILSACAWAYLAWRQRRQLLNEWHTSSFITRPSPIPRYWPHTWFKGHVCNQESDQESWVGDNLRTKLWK